MDAFEVVVAQLLTAQGYWTRTEYKVGLTKAEKRQIDRPTTPRWELDVVAYKAAGNKVLVVECKSYLDSPGVSAADLKPGGKWSSRFKLFVAPEIREVVLHRLRAELTEQGLCRPNPKVTLALAAGKVAGDAAALKAQLAQDGFEYFGPEWFRSNLRALADTGYENMVATVVAKLMRQSE